MKYACVAADMLISLSWWCQSSNCSKSPASYIIGLFIQTMAWKIRLNLWCNVLVQQNIEDATPPPSIYIIIWFIRVWNSNPVCCIIAMKDTKTEIYFRSCPGQKACWASASSLITVIMGSGRELIWIKEGQTMVANLSSLTGKWQYNFWILWRVGAFFFVSG